MTGHDHHQHAIALRQRARAGGRGRRRVGDIPGQRLTYFESACNDSDYIREGQRRTVATPASLEAGARGSRRSSAPARPGPQFPSSNPDATRRPGASRVRPAAGPMWHPENRASSAPRPGPPDCRAARSGGPAGKAARRGDRRAMKHAGRRRRPRPRRYRPAGSARPPCWNADGASAPRQWRGCSPPGAGRTAARCAARRRAPPAAEAGRRLSRDQPPTSTARSITIASSGTSSWKPLRPVLTFSIASTISVPPTTLPNTA